MREITVIIFLKFKFLSLITQRYTSFNVLTARDVKPTVFSKPASARPKLRLAELLFIHIGWFSVFASLDNGWHTPITQSMKSMYIRF